MVKESEKELNSCKTKINYVRDTSTIVSKSDNYTNNYK